MSVDEFNIAMGFEDEESFRSDKYRDAFTDLPSGFKVQGIWAQITDGMINIVQVSLRQPKFVWHHCG